MSKFKPGDWVQCTSCEPGCYLGIVGKYFRVMGGDFSGELWNPLDPEHLHWKIPLDIQAYDKHFRLVEPSVGQVWKYTPESQSGDGRTFSIVSAGANAIKIIDNGATDVVHKDWFRTCEAALVRETGATSQQHQQRSYNYKRSACPYCTLSAHNMPGYIIMPGHGAPLPCLECDPNA